MSMEQPQFNTLTRQNSLEGEDFEVSKEFILKNKETVTDFFGDNRHWYEVLLRGGQNNKGVSLDDNVILDRDPLGNDDLEILPLTPDRITEGRAENIAHFF